MRGTAHETVKTRDVIVVGASAGGVQALMYLLSKLPGELPAIIGLVLHRTPYHETQLAAVLGRQSTLRVIEPRDGTALERGCVYVAPRDQHLVFERGAARLSRGPREHMTRPAIDPLFRSAAAEFGARVAGVLLTGYRGGWGARPNRDQGGGRRDPGPGSAGGHTSDDASARDRRRRRRAVLPMQGIAAALIATASGRPIPDRRAGVAR